MNANTPPPHPICTIPEWVVEGSINRGVRADHLVWIINTYGIVEDSDTLTLSFFPAGEYRDALRYCGTKSGRDGDKFAATGWTVERTAEGTPYPAEANLVLVCRKLYADDLKENAFIDPEMLNHYAAKDYHRFYICEITEVLDYPGNKVYVVRGEKEYMIPAVNQFILSTDMEKNEMQVRLIEGMGTHEN